MSRVTKGRCCPQAGLQQRALSDSLRLPVIDICPCKPQGFSSLLEQDHVPGEACPAQSRWGKEVCPISQPPGEGWDRDEFSSGTCCVPGLERISLSQKHLVRVDISGWWSRGSTEMGGGGGSSRKGRNLQLGSPFVPPGAVWCRQQGGGGRHAGVLTRSRLELMSQPLLKCPQALGFASD